MKFSYELDSIGWANVSLEINDEQYDFSPSYLTNALTDFLRALEVLIPEVTESDEIKKVTNFSWNSEPAEHVWTLTRKNEIINLEIHEYEDGIDCGKKQVIFNQDINLEKFIKAVVSSLTILLRKHGIVGYRKQWYSEEFPLSSYLMLMQYLADKKISITKYNVNEWNEHLRSDIESEFELIKKHM
ncbi:hypothetical protein V3851_06090 [Paenibacillus sp. M1]|uniref:Uncharacterized protein n=1 Tax=Paenibacillus haidiansis TaxID=1574488 RepID=A0ABU7VR76_9BACL